MPRSVPGRNPVGGVVRRRLLQLMKTTLFHWPLVPPSDGIAAIRASIECHARLSKALHHLLTNHLMTLSSFDHLDYSFVALETRGALRPGTISRERSAALAERGSHGTSRTCGDRSGLELFGQAEQTPTSVLLAPPRTVTIGCNPIQGVRGMSRNSGRLTREELLARIADGSIDTVILAITDMQGRLQGKRLDGDFFVDVIVTAWSRVVVISGVGRRHGHGGRFRPHVLGPRLRRHRVSTRLHDRADGPLAREDGTGLRRRRDRAREPVAPSPRQVLQQQVSRLAERGWSGSRERNSSSSSSRTVTNMPGSRAIATDTGQLVQRRLFAAGTSRIEPLLGRIRRPCPVREWPWNR